MARLAGLKVVRSAVQGYGLITTRRRTKGSVITNVEGVLWRAKERRDDTYSLILDPGVFFDMVDQTRWVNHSCEPNVVVEAGVTKAGNGWAQLQALRELEPGEELFYDYALPAELKERCHCGATTCRGWIVEGATGLAVSARMGEVNRSSRPVAAIATSKTSSPAASTATNAPSPSRTRHRLEKNRTSARADSAITPANALKPTSRRS